MTADARAVIQLLNFSSLPGLTRPLAHPSPTKFRIVGRLAAPFTHPI
jgi:hypothetical protein